MRRFLSGLVVISLLFGLVGGRIPATKAVACEVTSIVPMGKGHGTLTPASQLVPLLGTATVTIGHDAGWHLVSLTDNGHAVVPLPSGTYFISSVKSNHVVAAAFAMDGILETVRVATGSYPVSLFPLISDSAYTAFAANFLMARPVGVTPGGELYGDLCWRVPTLDNGDLVRSSVSATVTTTVRLRSGLKWSDGRPLTIDDYIFSHQLYVNAQVNAVSRTPMDLVTGIVKVDDLTCIVTWSKWDPYIPLGWGIYPQHILGPIFDAHPADINTCDYTLDPIHAGPYVLESKVEGASMTFVINPFYWQLGKPKIPKVILRVVANTDDLVARMTSGEVDVSSEYLSLQAAQQFEITNGTAFKVYYNESTNAGVMQWNLNSVWFSDKRVRQAFYYGIDRTYITVQTMAGDNAVQSPLFPFAGSDYFAPVLNTYAYNPATANALLDAAGWAWNPGHTQRILPDSSPAVLTIPYSAGASLREDEVNLIRPMLAALGITVVNGPMDFNTMLDDCTYGTFTVALYGTRLSNYDVFGCIHQFHTDQIPTVANGWIGQNVCRYSSSAMDTWIDTAWYATTGSTLTDAYTHIQQVFAEDLPCFYLEQRIVPDEVRKGLLGYDHVFSSDVSCNWNVQDWSWDMYGLAATASPSAGGTVTKSPDEETYLPGTSVQLTATPSPGYTFTGWSGSLTGITNPAIITMYGSKTVTATFTAIDYGEPKSTHTWLDYRAGTSNVGSYGVDVCIDAFPSSPDPAWLYYFAIQTNFSEGGGGAHGGLQWASGGQKANWGGYDLRYAGDTQSIVVDQPWTTGTWYHYGVARGAQQLDSTWAWSFSITNLSTGTKHDLGVIYSKGSSISGCVVWMETGYGVVATTPRAQVRWRNPVYTYGALQSLAYPVAGYATYNGTCVEPHTTDQQLVSTSPREWIQLTNTPTRTTPANTYMWKDESFTLTTNSSPSLGGTIAKSPDQPSYIYGTSVTLTAAPSPGWTFTGWSGNLTGTANPSAVTMDAAKTVTATFAPAPATVSFGPSLTPGLVLSAGQTLNVPLLLVGDLEHAAYLDLYLEWYSLTGQGYSKITTVQVYPLSASQTYAWHIPADLVADTAYLTASIWRNDGTNGGAGSYSMVRSGVMIITPSGSVAAAVASPVAGVTLTGPLVPVTLHLGNLANPWGNILEVWFSPSGAPGSFVKVYHTTTGFASTMTPTVDLSFLGSGTWTACHFAVTVYVGGTLWRTNYSPTFTFTNP